MNQKPFVAFAVLVGAVSAIIAGCAKKVIPTPAAPPAVLAEPALSVGPPSSSEPPLTTAVPGSEDEMFARKSLAELNAENPLGIVYFEYDRSELQDEARSTLAINAEWLRRWSSTRIAIEGHCDEHGTAEYNLALGDRRAAVVRDYLVALGITAERVTTVSKGKETPLCLEPNEACWGRNRRGAPLIIAK